MGGAEITRWSSSKMLRKKETLRGTRRFLCVVVIEDIMKQPFVSIVDGNAQAVLVPAHTYRFPFHVFIVLLC